MLSPGDSRPIRCSEQLGTNLQTKMAEEKTDRRPPTPKKFKRKQRQKNNPKIPKTRISLSAVMIHFCLNYLEIPTSLPILHLKKKPVYY